MSKKSLFASDDITVIGFESEISPGRFLREYLGGRFPFLRFQIGEYMNLPQFAPRSYEKVIISPTEIRFLPRGAFPLPDKKLVFHVIGFGVTLEKALVRAAIMPSDVIIQPKTILPGIVPA